MQRRGRRDNRCRDNQRPRGDQGGSSPRNEQWILEAYTAEGFYTNLKNIGADTYNVSDGRFVMTLKGNYQFRNEAGQKYRAHGITHVTQHGDDVIVEFEGFEFFCVGNQ